MNYSGKDKHLKIVFYITQQKIFIIKMIKTDNIFSKKNKNAIKFIILINILLYICNEFILSDQIN